ncbi:MAG: PAC2 family protein [Ilumatobacteraceae bacterium]
MEHVRWLAEPELTNPILVAGFTGWNDAGDAASTAIRTLIEAGGVDGSGARALAEIDPEPFTDFATVRPHVRLDDEHRRHIVWPTVGVWSLSLPGADVVLVLGPEPALRWRSFCDQIVGLAQHLGSPLTLTLGALLADVPHTRPVQLVGTATDHELVERLDLERSRYEGPTGIVGVLQHALTEAGLPSASLWAAVPGYASQIPSPKAAVALVDRACAIMGMPAPVAELTGKAAEYEARVSSLVAEDDDLELYVARLESMLDEMAVDDELDDMANGRSDHASDQSSDRASGGDEGDQVDDGASEGLGDTDPDDLVEEVERFLRDRDDDS